MELKSVTIRCNPLQTVTCLRILVTCLGSQIHASDDLSIDEGATMLHYALSPPLAIDAPDDLSIAFTLSVPRPGGRPPRIVMQKGYTAERIFDPANKDGITFAREPDRWTFKFEISNSG